MIGFLAYIPTIAYIPHLVYVFLFLYIFIKKGVKMNVGTYSNLAIFLLIIVFSILNNFLHPIYFKKLTDYFPFLILILISLITAKHFSRKDAKILILLIAIEGIVVIIEYALGISTFFKDIPTYLVYEKSSLLYTNRPFGLSTNSSVIAQKILVAFTLLKFFNFKEVYMKIATIILAIACLLTFNRTVLVTLIFFYSLDFSMNFYKLKIDKIKLIAVSLILVSISLAFAFYAETILEVVINQFTRNKGKVELSGRSEIWSLFMEFINQNFFFGNGSFKYFIGKNGNNYHAHNSFLEVLATHGFYIFFMYIVLIIKNINKHNFVYILTFLVYSMSQYGIFWGISLLDILFLFYLFSSAQQKQISKIKDINLKNINYE